MQETLTLAQAQEKYGKSEGPLYQKLHKIFDIIE